MAVRDEVVRALVEAHRSAIPWAGLAAVAFRFDPSPTDAERAAARGELRRGLWEGEAAWISET